MSTALAERPCPKCGAVVQMTPARVKHGRYACNRCSSQAVKEWAARPENSERAKESSRRRTRAWQLRNPGKLPTADQKRAYDRAHHLKQKYGLTTAEYDALLVAQGGGCALCGEKDPRAMFGRFHIDHCHDTGRVRGLLCARCNLGLGCLGDQPERLRRALAYVEGKESVS